MRSSGWRVVGCSGSGKTTLAAALARALGVTHIELDSIYHQPGWTPLSDEEFRERVTAATKPDTWVVDGNYSVVSDIVWERADTVVWFDLPYFKVMARRTGLHFVRLSTQGQADTFLYSVALSVTKEE